MRGHLHGFQLEEPQSALVLLFLWEVAFALDEMRGM